MRRLHARERVPGGWMVAVEVENAYTDGTSRFDRVFVADQAVQGKDPGEIQQAISDALEDPFEGLRGADLDTPPEQTKALLEARMRGRFADWAQWRDTLAEAQARSLPAATVVALRVRTDAAWGAYAAAISQWRQAPQ